MLQLRHWWADRIERLADLAETLLGFLKSKALEIRPTYWIVGGSWEGSETIMYMALTTDDGPAYDGEHADDLMVRDAEHRVIDATCGRFDETDPPEVKGRTRTRSPRLR